MKKNWTTCFYAFSFLFFFAATLKTQDVRLPFVGNFLSNELGNSVSISGDYAFVGAPEDDVNGNNSGSVHVYKRSGGNWIQSDYLTPSGNSYASRFGVSVSISGDKAIVGNFNSEVFVFELSNGVWTESAILTPSDVTYNFFGRSVCIKGDRLIVGAPADSDNGYKSGAAYVFEYTAGSWEQKSKLTASDAAVQDNFGYSVSILGDNAVIGAYRKGDNYLYPGAAYTFVRSADGTWSQEAKLTASNTSAYDFFGKSVSIFGEYLIVGAPQYDSFYSPSGSSGKGAAYLFERIGGVWTEVKYLFDPNGQNKDQFGINVYILADKAVVGSPMADYYDTEDGAAFLYGRIDTKWKLINKLSETWDPVYKGHLGNSVYISGDYVIAGGAYNHIKDITESDWERQPKIMASDGSLGDYFGNAVDVSGDYAIIGAPNDHNQVSFSGSAYIYKKTTGGWSQEVKLLASEETQYGFFGRAVSISGDYAVVGAPGNGDFGTAYFYERNGNVWTEVLEVPGGVGGFGASVKISGDYAVVGEQNTGVHVFYRSVGGWIEVALLTPDNGISSPSFGERVSIFEDFIIVGAKTDNAFKGAAYVFEQNGGIWSQVAKLTASDAGFGDYFGHSVDITGEYVIVGAPRDDDNALNSGSAYIFQRLGGSWVQQKKLRAWDPFKGRRFGWSVSISGLNAVVGSPYSNDDNEFYGYNKGAAYHYHYWGEDWVKKGKLLSTAGVAEDYYGSAVGISGGNVIVGAPNDDEKAYNAGAAYFFEGITNIPPEAICQDVTVSVVADCQADVTVAQVDNDSSDPDGDEITLSVDPVGPYQAGTTEVTLTVDDGNGGSSSCTANIIVVENVAPVAQCQNITVQLDAQGITSITADQVNNGSNDNCDDNLDLSVSQDEFSCSDIGEVIVSLTVTDDNGNTSDPCTATVTIEDNVTPVPDVADLPDITGQCNTTVETVPTATDNCTGTIIGTTTDPLSYYEQGTYSVSWLYDDGNGNTFTQTQTVIVDDATAPIPDVASLPNASGECTVSVDAPTATDNCVGTVSATTMDPMFYDVQGTYSITWAYDDGNGNTFTQTQMVIVDDVTTPVPDMADLPDATGECTVSIETPTATDNCIGAINGTTTDPVTYNEQGTYSVNWTYDDGNGNTVTQVQMVIVADETAPVPDITDLPDVVGECSVNVNTPTATDNCTGTINGTTIDPIIYNAQGTYSITWTYDDGNGNTVTQTQMVIVDDVTAPIPDIANLPDAVGECSVNVNAPTATDNCTGTIIGTTTDPISYIEQGTYAVTWTYDDGNGNTATQIQTVIVADETAPVPDMANLPMATGQCSAGITTPPPTATDNCAGTITGTTTDPIFYEDQGTHIITWTYDDGNGNTSTQTQTVIVEDIIPPNITCPFDITVNVDAGTCGAIINYSQPSATDNCGTGILPTSLPGFTYMGMLNGHTYFLSNSSTTPEDAHAQAIATGGHLVTINDAAENLFVSNFNSGRIWIGHTDRDVEGTWEWITGEPVSYTNWAPGEPNNYGGNEDWAVINWSGNNPNWNDWLFTSTALFAIEFDGGTIETTLTSGLGSGSLFPPGTTTEIWNATDAGGNEDNCSFTVTVIDNIPPAALCQPITVLLDANGNGLVTTEDIDNGSNDACGIANLSINKSTFTCNDLGSITITLTVEDNNGNISSCSSIVTVEDNITPDAVCFDITLELENDGVEGVVLNQYDISASSDNCGIESYTISPGSFSCDDIGDNTITLVIMDASGNVGTCTATVTIEDPNSVCNDPPVAVCKDITVFVGSNCDASIEPEGVDNGSSDPDGDNLSLSLDDSGPFEVGQHVVILTVSDGEFSDNCTAMVTVEDNTLPDALCQNVTVQLDNTGFGSITASQVDNGSSDACGIGGMIITPSSFSCTDVGSNTVTLIVTDNNGNSSACTATVMVEDNVAPAAQCQNVTVQLDNTGSGSITASQVDNGSSDACGIGGMIITPSSFSCTDVGSNTVTLIVTDNNGNSSACTATVMVEDNVAPAAQCQNVTVQLDNTGAGTITAAQVNNGSSDACGIASMSVSSGSFTCTEVGSNTVTLTVTDNNSNSSTCTTTVTVEDNVVPVAQCQNVTVHLDNTGAGTITAAQVNNGSSDACGIASMSVTPGSFTCMEVGSNTVTLTVTDNNSNSSTCTAMVTVVDNIAPQIETPCPEDIVLCGAQNVSWIPPTATDNCAVVTFYSNYNPGDLFDVGVHIVAYTFYDAAGLSVSCDFTVTIYPVPQLEISQSNIPAWCQGVKILVLKVNNLVQLTDPVTYSWSDGLGNTPQVVALENGTYTVTVTDGNNCSTVGTVIVNEDLSTLLSSHTIIAGQQLDMSSSTVLNGGVGVLNGEEVTIQNNTDITTFLRSATAYIDGSSTVANYINSDSPVSLPPFVSNPYNDFNDIYVPSGGSMTLSGSNYGNVTVGKNATLTINNGTIYLRSLKVNTASTVIFNQPTNVMVRKKVSFGLLNNVNIGGSVTVIYSGDQVSVGQGSIIEANIYAPEGLEVNDSGASLTTYMIGLFIANDGVYSDDNVVWNWNLNCGDASIGNNGDFAELFGEETQEFPEEPPANKLTSALNVYPNPTSEIINIETPSLLGHKVEMIIYDPLGKAVLRRIIDELKIPIIQVDLASSQFTNGFYHVSLRSETEMVSARFILSK